MKTTPPTVCRWQDRGQLCGNRAMYLVLVPFGDYRPYCLAHVQRTIVHACNSEYWARQPGQRNPVQILPIDERGN
jgi:hypothetical protein